MSLSIYGLRALNEYRRVSIMTYLGLRYTLRASAARGLRWAEEIAPSLVERATGPSFLQQFQFKELVGKRHEYREMSFPGPNEALAEAALLAACQKAGGSFRPRPGVFSYHLAKPEDTDGCYRRFVDLFRQRQLAIGRWCKRHPSHIVLYADIRKFYPSASRRRAKSEWRKACIDSGLAPKWQSLGEKLLANQAMAAKRGLLVGPRFSHLLADLLLREVDNRMRGLCRGGYFRYVDDFAIVVPKDQLKEIKTALRRQLGQIGLKLHPKKFFTIGASEWRRQAEEHNEMELQPESGRLWMRFVDTLKGFLLTKPEYHETLRAQLRLRNFRFPLPRYRTQIAEARYVKKFSQRISRPWFYRRVSRASVRGICYSAEKLRSFYQKQFEAEWNLYKSTSGIEKKWALTRVRFLLSKLAMLADADYIARIRSALAFDSQLLPHAEIFNAIATRDLSEVACLGAPTSAVAGELLVGDDVLYTCKPRRWSRAAIDGYLTLRLMGINFSDSLPRHVAQRRIIKIIEGRTSTQDWKKMEELYLRELSALSAPSNLARHRDLVAAPLDLGEPFSLLGDEVDSREPYDTSW